MFIKEEKMTETNKLLPIGTVVMLKEGKKRVMITGFYSVSEQNQNTIYDYSGCLYPEGVISSQRNLLFNHSQIDKIYYMGYTDDEEKQFKEKLALAVKKLEQGN